MKFLGFHGDKKYYTISRTGAGYRLSLTNPLGDGTVDSLYVGTFPTKMIAESAAPEALAKARENPHTTRLEYLNKAIETAEERWDRAIRLATQFGYHINPDTLEYRL